MTGTGALLISTIGAGVLALLFIQAVWHKLTAAEEFRISLAAYELVPEWAAPMLAVLFTAAELAVILLTVVPELRVFGALGAAALLALYGGAIAFNLLRGRADISCGCGGPEPSLSWYLVLRNAVLAGMALGVAAIAPLGVLTTAELAMAAACVFLLWLACLIFNQLIGNHSHALSLSD